MISINGLNNKGKEKAKKFLLKYDKKSNDILYKMSIAVEQISNKIAESEKNYYELNSFSSNTNQPEVITFLNDELTFVDISE